MFNMSSPGTSNLETKRDPLSAILGGCVPFPQHTSAYKEACIEEIFFFPRSKSKEMEDREHRTYFLHFLQAITLIKLGKLSFLFVCFVLKCRHKWC